MTDQELQSICADAAKVDKVVQDIIDRRHTMCIPAQDDDFDLLLTRVGDSVPKLLDGIAFYRQRWISATAQAQRFALRLGMWSDPKPAPFYLQPPTSEPLDDE